MLELPGGRALRVTSLDKVYFPDDGITKGAVMRYYARVAPALLPAIAGRPLMLRRYPNGIAGPDFHQHDPGEHTPDGVRTAMVQEAGGDVERRLVGADPHDDPGSALATLLYTIQLGAIVVNPWHSRIESLETPDYAVLDLDPMPDAGFGRIVDVARLVHRSLQLRGLASVPKTSGSRGVHMLVPLPVGTTYDESAALALEIAEEVAELAPDVATVERSIDARPARSIYVDHMQNALGKTLAAVFSVRARRGALVSTPLAWSQVAGRLDPTRYTVRSVGRDHERYIAKWREAWREAGGRGV